MAAIYTMHALSINMHATQHFFFSLEACTESSSMQWRYCRVTHVHVSTLCADGDGNVTLIRVKSKDRGWREACSHAHMIKREYQPEADALQKFHV